MKTIVALYEGINHAHRAVDALQGESIPDECISVIASSRSRDPDRPRPGSDDAAGTVAGLGSLMAGLAALTIPAIGPVLAIGPLGAAAAATAAKGPDGEGGLTPSLLQAGVPVDDARRFVAAVRKGRALVMALVTAEQAEGAARALARCAPLDASFKLADEPAAMRATAAT